LSSDLKGHFSSCIFFIFESVQELVHHLSFMAYLPSHDIDCICGMSIFNCWYHRRWFVI